MYGFKTLPELSAFNHYTPQDGMCVMELVAFINGDEFTDTPPCTDRGIAQFAAYINDRLEKDNRYLILQEFDRLFDTSDLVYLRPVWFKELHAVAVEIYKEDCGDEGYGVVYDLIHEDPRGVLSWAICCQFEALRYLAYDRRNEPEKLVAVLSRVLDAADKALGRDEVKIVDRDMVEEKLQQIRKGEA